MSNKKNPTKKTRTAKVAKVAPKRAPRAAKKTVKAAPGAVISYPFTSKREIAGRIAQDANYALVALVQLSTADSAMCSQKKLVRDLATEIAEAGDGASSNEGLVSRVRGVVSRYTRFLAKEARQAQLAANPDLTKIAEPSSAA